MFYENTNAKARFETLKIHFFKLPPFVQNIQGDSKALKQKDPMIWGDYFVQTYYPTDKV